MRSKIYVGADGSRMLQDAIALAREALGTDNLEVHPDYLYIEPSGKKQIGVPDVLPVVEKGLNRAVLAPCAVAVINGFDRLTPAAQNKLLLTLEANKNVAVIGIAASLAPVLETVRSRVEITEYRKSPKSEFSEFSDPSLFCDAFCGDLNLARQRKKDAEVILAVSRDVREKPENLLKTLHLLEEKDKAAVTGDRVLMGAVLQALKHSLVEAGMSHAKAGRLERAVKYCDLTARLDEEDGRMKNTSYTKDDFFLAVMEVIEGLR